MVTIGLGIFVGGEDMTHWFNAASLTDDKEFDNVTLTKKNVTQLEVSYKSGKYTHLHGKLTFKYESVFIKADK